MHNFSRRAFVEASVGSVTALCWPRFAAAQTTQCQSSGHQVFLPDSLTVDCASRQNFQLFRKYSDYLGLAGVVSMTYVQGKLGSFNGGNLFLFPWVKPEGREIQLKQGKTWPAVVPAGPTFTVPANPIPGTTLPPDEYFCRVVLQAPYASFIGFQVDTPFSSGSDGRPTVPAGNGTTSLVRPMAGRTTRPSQPPATAVVTLPHQRAASTPSADTWVSNVDKLADGEGVGIDWTSSNLNQQWFGGSQAIPNTDTCNGLAWRQLIVDTLYKVSSGIC
jgi:hypothetical protein